MMTTKQLKRYNDLCQEIKDRSREVSDLQKQEKLTTAVKASMIEFPYIQHTVLVNGGQEPEDKEWRQEMYTYLRGQIAALRKEKREIEHFINDCEDSQLRQAMRLRFFDGRHKNWITVANKLSTSEDTIKSAFYRHLRKYNLTRLQQKSVL